MVETLDISTDDCIVERDGAVVIMTMNRPEKRNALSPTMLVGLADAYTYIDETPEVRAAILTGAGNTFSSGMDLVAANQPRSEYVERRTREEPNLHWKALLRDYRCTKPMIAAVEGYAVAGGTEMLQGTDIRVAGRGAVTEAAPPPCYRASSEMGAECRVSV
jgi:enoyl-CoA hydratase